ncbi:DUF6174 domain-containing protein [Thiothrix winogradskyi]|uniref:DUF6174 domain-containing protein n=1 Tax=Thiothrix winogradskyi TaxID=96472 RepID=A0ABY3SZB0_9GAMM|nr:DUF6174 domain-containing protein [Thiothrix winogradskyi]UJS24892.1 DUF6174 domain-containing protein [Thiothrix winogradskyi]
MKYILLTTLCAGLLSGCVATNPAVTDNTSAVVQHPAASAESYFAANRDLLAAETKWRQHRPAHYRYTLQRSCFCSVEFRKPIAIEVSGSTVTKSTVDGVALALERRADALTVEDLFDIIRKAIDSKAARISVQYDLQNGRPLSISVDQNLQIADEEMHYTASDFKEVTKAKPKAKKKVKKSTKK